MATALDANALFMDLFAKNIIKGPLDFSIHANSNLQSESWLNALQGNGTLSIKGGELFIDLDKSLDDAINKLNTLLKKDKEQIKQALQQGLYDPTPPQAGKTSFQSLFVEYSLKDRKFLADSLSLQTSKLQITGKGYIDMSDLSQQLDLQAKILANHMVDKIQTWIGGAIPITLSGTVLNPNISTNLKGMSQLLSRYLLKTTMEKPIKTVRKHLENLLLAPEDSMEDQAQ